MPAIVTLVIYLSTSDAADSSTPVLVSSAQEILGGAGHVMLREGPGDMLDGELSSVAPDADAVANIAWLGTDHRHARVRCYVAKLHRLMTREIAFDAESAPAERERMLGFVVASMLPTAPEQPNPEPPKTTPAPTVPMHASALSLAPAERFVGLVEAVGLGAAGVNGAASTFGASVAARWLFGRKLALRMAFGLRRGDIPAASATSEVDFLGLGLAVEYPVAQGSRFAIGGRASALLMRHVVAHLSADDSEPDSKSRLLPGVDALLEGAWQFSSSAGVLAGIGNELAFGRTDVVVKGKEITDIPWLRMVAELGVQAKF